MTRSGLFVLGFAAALAACTPTTSYVAYDSWDYDFRYAIYDDYWDSDDINRPDRPKPPADLGPRPTPPIYKPPSRPAAKPMPASRPSGGRTGGAGSLRGSRR